MDRAAPSLALANHTSNPQRWGDLGVQSVLWPSPLPSTQALALLPNRRVPVSVISPQLGQGGQRPRVGTEVRNLQWQG